VPDVDLTARSIRTWAWLGDAEFEREVRRRVAARGDLPLDRLDAVKTAVVRAPSQARLLTECEPDLDDAERAIVRRARNAAPAGRSRAGTELRVVRAATAFEALVAHWHCNAPDRWEELVVPRLEAAIDLAIAERSRRPRRG
jgi:ribonuclease-3 family protein